MHHNIIIIITLMDYGSTNGFKNTSTRSHKIIIVIQSTVTCLPKYNAFAQSISAIQNNDKGESQVPRDFWYLTTKLDRQSRTEIKCDGIGFGDGEDFFSPIHTVHRGSHFLLGLRFYWIELYYFQSYVSSISMERFHNYCCD